MKNSFVPSGKPYIVNEEIKIIKKIFKFKWICSGLITEKFETKFKI